MVSIILILPLKIGVEIVVSHLENKTRKGRWRQWLSEDVRNLKFITDMKRFDEAIHISISNGVAIYFDVFGPFMKNWVGGDVDGSLVITGQGNNFGFANTKVAEKNINPNDITSS